MAISHTFHIIKTAFSAVSKIFVNIVCCGMVDTRNLYEQEAALRNSIQGALERHHRGASIEIPLRSKNNVNVAHMLHHKTISLNMEAYIPKSQAQSPYQSISKLSRQSSGYLRGSGILRRTSATSRTKKNSKSRTSSTRFGFKRSKVVCIN